MIQAADRLERILAATQPRLAGIFDADGSQPSAPGGWSRKEILGHLIDSAANNHQRFVRAQLAPAYDGPTYEQDQWVSAQAYAEGPWPDLVNLWWLYNRHLLHIIRHMPEASLPTPCVIAGAAPVPLSEVIASYVDHLEHHLTQILN